MIDEGQIIGETDFKVIDKKELEELKNDDGELMIENGGNLKDDLIKLGFLDYENMSNEEKKIFDELENEKRFKGYYELD